MLSSAAFFTLILASTIAAAPPSVQCDNIKKYSTEWFLDNVRADYVGALEGVSLFYSRGMAEQARALSRSSRDIRTIWDIWPCELFDTRPEPQNPLRCIHQSRKQQIEFFENMSRAYARKAVKVARVLHSAVDYAHPPLDGIWGRVELAELKRGDIDWLEKLHEDLNLSEIFWSRLQSIVTKLPLPRLLRQQTLDLKRAASGGYGGSCMAEHEYKVFDDLPW